MPARGSFQKHQKEIARKEKRQQKLDRRQGRTQPGAHNSESSGNPDGQPLDNAGAAESNSAGSESEGTGGTSESLS